MRLMEVEINNCFKYGTKGNTFDFSKAPLTLLVGSNGAGKSAIFDAVCFALFEKTIRWGQTHTEIVRRGQDFGSVILRFEKNDKEYEIQRGKSVTGKVPIFAFKCTTTGEVLASKSVKEGNKAISEIIGTDFDAFRNSVLFGQEDIQRIVSLRSGDRLSLLTRFLGIEFLDKCLDSSSNLLSLVRFEVEEIDGKLGSVSKLDIKKKIKGFEELREQIATDLQESKEKLENYSELFKKVSRLKDGATSASSAMERAKESIAEKTRMIERLRKAVKIKPSDIKRLEERLEKILEKREDLPTLKNRGVELGEVVSELRENLAVAKSLIKGCRIKVKQIKRKKRCIECNREYDEQTRRALIGKVEHEAESIQVKITQLTKNIEQKQSELVKIKKEILTIESLGLPESIEAKIKEGMMSRNSESEIEKLTLEIEGKQRLIARQQMILGTIKDEGYTEERLTQIHERMVEIQGHVSTKEANLGSIEQGINDAREKLQVIANLEKKRESAERRIGRLSFVNNIFSKTGGLRQIVVENVLPVLNEKTNRYLDALTTEPITVEFTTGAMTKSGKYRDKLDILISTPNGTADFESYSGGEKKSIVMAMGLGLSELASESVGVNCEFLLLDEVFSSLDGPARKRLVVLLYSLQKKFRNVIVISHLPELRSQIPNVVVVKRKRNLSVIVQ